MKYLWIFIAFIIVNAPYKASCEKAYAKLCYKVCNVPANDILNIREKPSNKSQIITTIPYNSFFNKKNCIDYPEEVKGWVCITYEDQSSNLNYKGWVYGDYLCETPTFLKGRVNGISFSYPAFLDLIKKNNDVILRKTTFFRHERYQDGEYGVVSTNKITDFNLRINSNQYNSINEALEDESNRFLKIYIEKETDLYQTGKKIDDGFLVSTGVEGVGEYFFIIRKHSKVLIGILDYNNNPITPLQRNIPFLIDNAMSINVAQKILNSVTWQ